MFGLSRLERSSIRLLEVGHLTILTQGAYIKRYRLKVEVAALSMFYHTIIKQATHVLYIGANIVSTCLNKVALDNKKINGHPYMTSQKAGYLLTPLLPHKNECFTHT